MAGGSIVIGPVTSLSGAPVDATTVPHGAPDLTPSSALCAALDAHDSALSRSEVSTRSLLAAAAAATPVAGYRIHRRYRPRPRSTVVVERRARGRRRDAGRRRPARPCCGSPAPSVTATRRSRSPTDPLARSWRHSRRWPAAPSWPSKPISHKCSAVDFVDQIAERRERSLASGPWLADVVARDPALRARAASEANSMGPLLVIDVDVDDDASPSSATPPRCSTSASATTGMVARLRHRRHRRGHGRSDRRTDRGSRSRVARAARHRRSACSRSPPRASARCCIRSTRPSARCPPSRPSLRRFSRRSIARPTHLPSPPTASRSRIASWPPRPTRIAGVLEPRRRRAGESRRAGARTRRAPAAVDARGADMRRGVRTSRSRVSRRTTADHRRRRSPRCASSPAIPRSAAVSPGPRVQWCPPASDDVDRSTPNASRRSAAPTTRRT